MKIHHQLIQLSTENPVHIIDITARINALITELGIKAGIASVSSQHTTLAVTVNENEERLMDDIPAFFETLAPSDAKYLHNDLHLRDCPPNEPENAHAHLIAMSVGNSESLSVVDGKLVLGTYQSVMAVELDGPRERKVSVQIVGQ